MPRRYLPAALLGASLTIAGLGVLLSPVAAAQCPSWVDPKGDSTTAQTGQATLKDDNMDIVNTAVSVSGDTLSATISTLDLITDGSTSDAGDEFGISFELKGQTMYFYVQRTPELDDTVAYFNLDSEVTVSGGKRAYDVAAKSVTITHSLAGLKSAVGSDIDGQPMTAIRTYTANQLAQTATMFNYDVSAMPAPATLNVAPCSATGGGGPAPSPTVSLPPVFSGAPSNDADRLKADCRDLADAKGDGTPNAPNGAHKFANDPDLDIIDVAMQTNSDAIKFYLRIDKLGMPAQGFGHKFDVKFTHNGKAIVLTGAEATEPAKTWLGTTYPQGTVGGTANTAIKPKVTFDKATSQVILAVSREALGTVADAPVANNVELGAFSAVSNWFWTPTAGQLVADTAQAADAEARVMVVGTGVCFGPPPAKLVNAGVSAVQYGDTAAVAAKLTSSSGAALANKTLSFALAGRTVTAKTDAAGVARAAVPVAVTAGATSLAVTFAGDTAAAAAQLAVPFTVRAETTRLTLAVAKSGTKRVVTATLKDDDGKAVAGQKVNWYVNGRKVATATTDSLGRVVLRTAVAGQTVVAEFLAVTGKYAASKVTAKV